MMRITKSAIAPNPKEFDYWVDLTTGVTKYYNNGVWEPIGGKSTKENSVELLAIRKAFEDYKILINTEISALKTKINELTKRITALENNK